MKGTSGNRKVLCDIAQCAFEVVSRQLSRDQLLARALRTAETTSRQFIREETITSEMAATLLEQFPKHIEFTLFTPAEEKLSGADWYWRFEKDNRAIHALVQAKRVQRSEFEQRDSDGSVDIDLEQLDQLVHAAQIAQLQLRELHAWVATYARHDAPPPCTRENLQDCRNHHHIGVCDGNKNGRTIEPSLWIANASAIRGMDLPSLRIPSVVKLSVRLDCILPCIDGPETSPGPATKDFFLRDGLLPYKDCISYLQNDQALSSRLRGALRIMA